MINVQILLRFFYIIDKCFSSALCRGADGFAKLLRGEAKGHFSPRSAAKQSFFFALQRGGKAEKQGAKWFALAKPNRRTKCLAVRLTK